MEIKPYTTTDIELISAQLTALLTDEKDWISALSNTSAFLNEVLDDINWVGFYLLKENQLVLGPFQGKVACSRIQIGKGVCGTAVATKETQRIEDVHKFPGHIACDSASQSELVCLIESEGKIIGLLDIDSPHLNRFDETDQKNMERVTEILGKHYLSTQK